jgi:hypothetical protein
MANLGWRILHFALASPTKVICAVGFGVFMASPSRNFRLIREVLLTKFTTRLGPAFFFAGFAAACVGFISLQSRC